jgi:hypothetical protein
MVRGRVVIWRAVKDLDSDGPFLEPVAKAVQSLVDDVFQDGGIAAAVVKGRAGEDLSKLIADLVSL